MVREGTHVAELAVGDVVRVALTEFRLVFFGVVEVLDCVVRAIAIVACWAVAGLLAKHRRVGTEGSAFVLRLVIEHAPLLVVSNLHRAWLSLELR